MRHVFVWLVLALLGGSLGGLTRQRVNVWSSDLTLWSDAVRVNPRLPQARVNLAGAYLAEGWWEAATTEDARALIVAMDRPEEPIVRRLVSAHLRWITLFTHLCESPAWAPRCSSS